MTAIDYVEEARECVLEIGGGRPAGDTYERMLWRVVQKTGLTYSRAWKLLYRRVRQPSADEMDALRRAREREKALIQQRWAHVALDNNWAETVAGFERLTEDVEEGAVRRGDATALQLATSPAHASRPSPEEVGRLLDGKAHRVGAR